MKTLKFTKPINYNRLNWSLGKYGALNSKRNYNYIINGVITLKLGHYTSKKGLVGGYMALPESYSLIKKNFGETTRLDVFSCTNENDKIKNLVWKIEVEEGNPQTVKKDLETAGLEATLQ